MPILRQGTGVLVFACGLAERRGAEEIGVGSVCEEAEICECVQKPSHKCEEAEIWGFIPHTAV